MTPKIRTLALLVLLAGACSLIVVRCWNLRRPPDDPKHPSLAGMCDFQDVVYYPTRAAYAGVNPYDARPPAAGGEYLAKYPAGNEFSPYAPLLFVLSAPLAALPLTPAQIAFCTLNLLLLVAYAYVLLRLAGPVQSALGVIALTTFLLLSRPGQSNYYYGQTTLVFVLATIGAWRLAPSRPRLAALCLAVALIKPTFGGPLAVLLVARGAWRAALLAIAAAAIVNVAILAALLPTHFTSREALTRLIENQTATDEDPAVDPLQSASRLDLPFVAERLSGRPWPPLARYGLTLAILATGGWHLRRLCPADPLLATGFACLTVTICIYHNIYDALLVAPAGVAMWRCVQSTRSPRDRRLAGLALALLLVPAVHFLSSKQFLALVADLSPPLASLVQHDALWTLLCVLNGMSLTAAWCVLLLLGRHGNRQVAPSSFGASRHISVP